MTRVWKSLVLAGAASLAASFGVFAQTNGARANIEGEMTSVSGPEGAVLVVRGTQTYFLAIGDQLIAGDQVFTRSNGSASIFAEVFGTECVIQLPSASSIVLNAEVCSATPVTLAFADVVGGVAIGAGGVGGGGPATTPVLLGLFGAGGAVAAAAGGGGDGGTPASP